ncbi:sugar phosphate isomerase [Pseudoclavibacter sp. AY1F1]|uniref:sugar phosphate isomerase/epimerase family protein n=1 Tax=Pseudoclavibacter sp. AY1F1 TaxID=2080583 RepID=UPI000CE90C22|nr:sugar phosphate isomerase/epimerase [Pseudoclavibacter sp. AY1F1]PPF44400.1 sugar phosphate isomerase [Pseudoclavibacter sp. AY1F1]
MPTTRRDAPSTRQGAQRPATSLQLYSINSHLEADLDGTLARLSEIGLRNVEAFAFVERADELAAAFARHGISAPTGHAMLVAKEVTREGVTTQVPSHASTFEAAKKLGIEYVIDPAVFDWSTREAVEATAEALNDAARAASEHGLRVGYHNHAWELSNTIDGVPALEFFAGLLDDEVVLEIDVYWAHIGGVDAPALLSRLGDRVKALHIKDGPQVENPFLTETPFDPSGLGQVPAGQGVIPLGAALDAAPSAEFAVIEFDHFDGDIFAAIAASFDYLENRA